jgi:hypothetical protein
VKVRRVDIVRPEVRRWPYSLALMILFGCTTTTLTDSWQAPALQRKAMDNVLVVAVTGNSTNRVLFEEGFVNALRSKAINATASHTAIGNTMPDRDNVTAYVERNDIAYVVVSDYSGIDITRWVVPESVRTYYTGPYYPSYHGYWDSYDTITVTRESYVEETRTVMLSTSIFEASTGSLVWAGRSKSFQVDSVADDARSLASQIVGSIRN